METNFFLTEMQYVDDYGFLDHHHQQQQQQMNLANEFFDTNIDDDIALGLLEDNFANDEIDSAYPSIPITSGGNSSNSYETSLERPAKQSRRSASSNQMSSEVRNENMEIPLENTSSREEAEKLKSKCPNRGQSHIMAERMRRERLTERFIALSALIPGLKRNDKGSVLCEAIKYVKQLQQRMTLLEEQNKKLSGVIHPSVVFLKNSKSLDEDVSNISSNSGTVHGNSHCDVSYESLPQVEAKVLDKQVLIRIHCKKHKEVLMNVLREFQNCHLVIVNSNVMPFGNSFVDITILAQMEKEDDMVVNVLARNLGFALSGSES